MKQPIVLPLTPKKLSWFEYLLMVPTISFISKPIMGQICIKCAFESDHNGIYFGHKGMYSMVSLEI